MESERVPLMASSSVLMLVGAGRILGRRVESELAGLGLTLRHLGALGHLVHRPELSYSDLARRAGVTAQSMHATVRGLEELGAVRRALPGQGHRARLEVTDRGHELLDRVRASAQRLDDELLADLTDEQRAALRAALRSLVVPPGPGPSLAP
ncbi:MarR family winged helix-turn-helix transcriptional regulator [Pseudonocardia broussonetiae]|nr:MarR family transcriptional regulator [Pseudonocardia broussonetiae]